MKAFGRTLEEFGNQKMRRSLGCSKISDLLLFVIPSSIHLFSVSNPPLRRFATSLLLLAQYLVFRASPSRARNQKLM